MSDDPADWGAVPVHSDGEDPLAWGAKPAAEKPQVSGWESAGRGAAQGLSFGLADEIEAITQVGGAKPYEGDIGHLATGLYKYWSGDKEAEKTYNEAIERERKANEAAKASHPYIYGGSELAGALPTMAVLPEASFAKIASPLARSVLKGAQVGSEYGALQGAGEGTDLTSRLTGATVGAGEGVVGGAIAPIVGKAVESVARPAVKVVRGWINPEGESASRLLSALQKDQELIQAGKSTGMTPTEWADAVRRGEPVTLADLGSSNTQALLRSAANTSPDARAKLEKFVGDRFLNQQERVAEDVRNLVSGGANAGKTADQLVAEYDKARVPAYRKAYTDGDRELMTPKMNELLNSPTFAKAMKDAVSSGQDRATLQGYGAFNPPVTFENGVIKFNRGKTGAPTYPNLQYWDAVKRELDDMATSAGRAGNKELADRASQLRNILRDELDKQVPSYKNARSIAADFFGESNALDAGRKMAGRKVDPAQISAMMRKMKPDEQDLFREGYASDWANRVIGNISETRDITKAMFNSPNERARALAVFGHSGVAKLEARMTLEKIMDGARQAMGNSTTARQLIEAGLAGGAGAAIGEWEGGPWGGVGGFAAGALGHRVPGIKPVVSGAVSGARTIVGYVDRNVASKVADLLTSQDPAVLRQGIAQAAGNKRILDGLKQIANRVALAGGMKAAPRIPPRVIINTAEFGQNNAKANEANPQGEQRPDQGIGGKSHGGKVTYRSMGGSTNIAMQIARQYARGGKVAAEKALDPNHKFGMRVEKGGSKCANCKFLATKTTCGNEGFIEWHGSPNIPAPIDSYCCDNWQAHKKQAGFG